MKGILLLLTSALSFALSTVFVKLVVESSSIPAIELTFFRFSFGFLFVAVYVALKKKSLIPVKARYVALRALFNTSAVICFFLGIQYSTVSKANILNMTYPIFVFLLSPLLNREKTLPVYYLFLITTMAGLFFIVMPGSRQGMGINPGDLYALASGILAALAITTLRQSRKYDNSYVILFYLMGFGALSIVIAVIPFYIPPRGMTIVYIAGVVITSFIGQLTITAGYKHINASAGSLVSSTRILFAVILGVSFFGDALNTGIIIGGILILSSLFGISMLIKEGSAKAEAQ